MKLLQVIGINLLLLCSWISTVQADPADLYTGKVVVASEQPADRERAIQQAFAQVLVKLSGQSKTALQFGLSQEPARPSQWVQQYRYEGSSDADERIIYLQANFDPAAINSYLKKSKVSIWSGERPLTLIWIAVEENGAQHIVGEPELDLMNWQSWFEAAAKARAVPVIFPLLDLTDKQQVSITDVWYHVMETLQQAADRYQAPNVLSGRIYKNIPTDTWSADWLLSMPEDKVNWQQEAATPHELILNSVDRFADELAQRMEQVSAVAQTSGLVLKVDNVRDLQTYVRVLSYLQSLKEIATLTPTQVTPDSVTFSVSLAIAPSVLQQKLALDQLLKALPDTNDKVLHYQYL